MIFSIADIFIKRPVLTTVCTIVIVLLGAVSIPLLPIEYIPQIAPIQVNISATYNGADPETIEKTVTTPIERKLNGTEGMEYFTSTSSAGSGSIQAFFGINTNKDINQVNVQNNIAQAIPLLPTPVQQQGVVVETSSTSILQVFGFYAPNGEYDAKFIGNYVDLFINDEIARIPGVGKVTIFGSPSYAMRFWLNPDALSSRSLTITDVIEAIQSQNVVVGGGAVGSEPVPKGQEYQIPLKLNGMFKNAEDAGNLVIKTGKDGTLTRLRDVGRAELGTQSYGLETAINGKPGAAFAIYQLPGSNAVDVATQVKAKLKELEQNYPPGFKSVLVYDTVGFIEDSTKEVLVTLLEAIVLVVIVIFIFLQDWRVTIIPALAIPVSLIGAMVFAKVLGFSVNSLTMLGLVLATGLVVDDGIVVVEAIVAKMQRDGLSARHASLEAMGELTGAIIATSLVMMAVFVPVAFFPGATGIMYKQFALIIAFSIGVSTFNALSFSPSMAAILLRPTEEKRGPLGWFFNQFNRGLTWVIERYTALVQFFIQIRYIILGVFVAGLAATVYMFSAVPTGFVPNEDQGSFLGIVQAPDIASTQYTNQTIQQIQQILNKEDTIAATATVAGAGLSSNGPNQGLFFALLKPWDQRTSPSAGIESIIQRLNKQFSRIPTSLVQAFNPPPIPGFSPTGGSSMQLQDTTGGKYTFQDFQANAQEILKVANENPVYGGRAYTLFSASTPQFEINFDRDQLNRLNVDFDQALSVLSASIGSAFVNQFVYGSRYYQVYVQFDGEFRNQPQDLKQIYVRSRTGNMVSMDQVVSIKPFTGPANITHFNEYRSILLQGNPAPGFSSGQGLTALEAAYNKAHLPGISFSWSDLSREEVSSAGLAPLIFLFGIIMVFLVLSAQYESYIDPTIIMLTVPLAILGALLTTSLRGLVNNVYCNIALVMLIGLASKNAILIVEFANQARERGQSIVQSVVTACEERFRPIMMTVISALVGFWPLVVASGPGGHARNSIGTAVFGGLLISTALSLLIVPVLYVVIKKLEDRFLGGNNKPGSPPPEQGVTGLEPSPAAGIDVGEASSRRFGEGESSV